MHLESSSKSAFGKSFLIAAFALSLNAVVLSSGRTETEPPSGEPPLLILYTGDLFGYARSPNLQTLKKVAGNPLYLPQPNGGKSGPAGQYEDLFKEARSWGQQEEGTELQTLILGTGDNLAMDYYSRVVVIDRDSATPRYIPKDELFYDECEHGWWDVEAQDLPNEISTRIRDAYITGKTSVGHDNVADFFIDLGYDALVPGKHDFYFGPERLRQIARYLATASPHPVKYLGANLIIRSKWAKRPPPQPEFLRKKHRGYKTDSGSPLKWELPKAMLPWNRRFRLSGAVEETNAELCVLEGNRDKEPTGCVDLTNPGPDHQVFLRDEEGLLRSGATYAVCVKSETAPKYCQPFDIHAPFFGYPETHQDDEASGPASAALACGPSPDMNAEQLKPYLVKKNANAVVFGIVEHGLEKKVGLFNTAWWNEDRRFETQVETIEPAEALYQATNYCYDVGDCTDDTRLVLLAHMPRAAAQSLARWMAAKGRFLTIVISRADDDYATAPDRVEYAPGHPTVTLTPYEPFSKPNRQAEAMLNSALLKAGTNQNPTGGGLPSPLITQSFRKKKWNIPKAQTYSSFRSEVEEAWCALTRDVARIPSRKDAKKKTLWHQFQTLALHAMREASNADVALLQERDFFNDLEVSESQQRDDVSSNAGGFDTEEWCSQVLGSGTRLPGNTSGPDNEERERTIEQILWKGDFIFTRTVKGSALKDALKESQRLQKLEQDLYSFTSESGRGLTYLGVLKDSTTEQWYVNGAAIEDNVLYAVAMTDFLAFGDTGFPELQEPAVPPKKRYRQISNLKRLSSWVLSQICKLSRACESSPDDQVFETYVDYSKIGPFLSAPTANRWHQLASLYRQGTNEVPSATSYRDVIGQERPYWRIFFDKLELTFAEYNHNRQTQDEVKDAFLGVNNDAVNRRESRTLGTAIQFEVRLERKSDQLFARFEEALTNERTLDDEERRFLDNFKENSISLELGYRRPFPPWTPRQSPWLGGLFSFEFSSQVRTPRRRLDVKVDCTDCSTDEVEIERSLPRTSRYLAKAGVRTQGRRSWLETGLFWGVVKRPVRFSLVGEGVAKGMPCGLVERNEEMKKITTTACLMGRFPLMVDSTQKDEEANIGAAASGVDVQAETSVDRESGAFINFNFRWDFPKGWGFKEIVMENRGRYFFNHGTDTPVDTKYFNRFSVSPTIPIRGSFSLKPTYSLMIFKNKVEKNSITGNGFEIKLEYRFDWKSGGEWSQALRYGRP